jgi:hypothetical protein
MTALFTATGSVDGDDDDGEVPDEVAIVTDVNINSVLENPRVRICVQRAGPRAVDAGVWLFNCSRGRRRGCRVAGCG